MKRKILISFLITLCLVLSACAQNNPPPNADPIPSPDSSMQQEQQDPSSEDTATPPENNEDTQQTITPIELTIELVVEWEDADALLSRLEEMGSMLRMALEEVGYPMERVTLTISTAGGFTAEALVQGGVDAAVLPAVDFITCSQSVAGIAMSSEEVSETVIALSLADGQPSSDFCAAFFDALTKTDPGQGFLSLCRPGAVFTVPTEEAMQAVYDWVAEQQKETTGGLAE